jgi:hypothetical protein
MLAINQNGGSVDDGVRQCEAIVGQGSDTFKDIVIF